jgi:hypothetical protein
VPAKPLKVPEKYFQGIKKSAAFTAVVKNYCWHFRKSAGKSIYRHIKKCQHMELLALFKYACKYFCRHFSAVPQITFGGTVE